MSSYMVLPLGEGVLVYILSDEREWSVTGNCHMMGQIQFGTVKHYNNLNLNLNFVYIKGTRATERVIRQCLYSRLIVYVVRRSC